MKTEELVRELTILVVDDDVGFSKCIVTSMIISGHRSMTIGNGHEAADYYRNLVNKEGLPDLLLVDLSLPDLKGVEFLQQLAKEGILCTVLVMSADLSEEDIKELIRTPHVGVLNKKDNLVQLVNELHKYFPKPLTAQRPKILTEAAKALQI